GCGSTWGRGSSSSSGATRPRTSPCSPRSQSSAHWPATCPPAAYSASIPRRRYARNSHGDSWAHNQWSLSNRSSARRDRDEPDEAEQIAEIYVVGLTVIWTSLRNFTGLPLTVAGVYFQVRAAVSAALS